MTSQFMNFTNQLVTMQNFYLNSNQANSGENEAASGQQSWTSYSDMELSLAISNHSARIQRLEEESRVQIMRTKHQGEILHDRIDDVQRILLRQTEKLADFQVV